MLTCRTCETSKKSPTTKLNMHHMKVFPTRMKDENNEKTKMMISRTTSFLLPLLGCQRQGQKRCVFKSKFNCLSPSWMPRGQSQRGIQILFVLLLNLIQIIPDPVGSLFFWSRDQSHCFNQVGPKTQRFG